MKVKTLNSPPKTTKISLNEFPIGCRYIPNVTGAIYDVLKDMSRQHASKKKRYDAEDAELLKKVSSEIITKETLSEKLAQHVEQVILVKFFHLFCKNKGT